MDAALRHVLLNVQYVCNENVFIFIRFVAIDTLMNIFHLLLLLPPFSSSLSSSGSDVNEANSSDSRGERLDFFVKQEDGLGHQGDGPFMGPSPGSERGDDGPGANGVGDGGGAGIGAVGRSNGGGNGSSVANLRAALMSKNSLLSLRSEILGDDSPLLFEYKGGSHSLSRK